MSLWRKYSLSIVLGTLWLSNWVLYGVSLEMRPEGFSWQSFWEGTFENSTSEFLQLFSFVVLAAIFVHVGSPQSKDSDEETQRKLDAILRRIKETQG